MPPKEFFSHPLTTAVIGAVVATLVLPAGTTLINTISHGAIIRWLGGLTIEDFQQGGKAQLQVGFIPGGEGRRGIIQSQNPDACPAGWVNASSNGLYGTEALESKKGTYLPTYTGNTAESFAYASRVCYKFENSSAK